MSQLKISSNEENAFIQLSHNLTDLVGKEGLPIVPYKDTTVPYFSSLGYTQKGDVLDRLKNMITLGETLQPQNMRLRDSTAVIWAFFKYMGLSGPSDILAHITPGDMVEVYNAESKLICATLNFFEVCDYSLEELYCRPWTELFIRDNMEAQKQLMELCMDIMTGKQSGVIYPDYIPEHRIAQVNSPANYAFIKPHLFAPVYERGKIAGFMCVNRLRRPNVEELSQ